MVEETETQTHYKVIDVVVAEISYQTFNYLDVFDRRHESTEVKVIIDGESVVKQLKFYGHISDIERGDRIRATIDMHLDMYGKEDPNLRDRKEFRSIETARLIEKLNGDGKPLILFRSSGVYK